MTHYLARFLITEQAWNIPSLFLPHGFLLPPHHGGGQLEPQAGAGLGVSHYSWLTAQGRNWKRGSWSLWEMRFTSEKKVCLPALPPPPCTFVYICTHMNIHTSTPTNSQPAIPKSPYTMRGQVSEVSEDEECLCLQHTKPGIFL